MIPGLSVLPPFPCLRLLQPPTATAPTSPLLPRSPNSQQQEEVSILGHTSPCGMELRDFPQRGTSNPELLGSCQLWLPEVWAPPALAAWMHSTELGYPLALHTPPRCQSLTHPKQGSPKVCSPEAIAWLLPPPPVEGHSSLNAHQEGNKIPQP